jgi:hypothetical protein
MANSVFEREVAAIRRIRASNPKIGAYTLAKQIRNGEITDPHADLTLRTRLSTLSVIRRYDAAIKAGKTPALAVA